MTGMKVEMCGQKRDGQSEEVKVKSTEHDHHLLPFIWESQSTAVITADISEGYILFGRSHCGNKTTWRQGSAFHWSWVIKGRWIPVLLIPVPDYIFSRSCLRYYVIHTLLFCCFFFKRCYAVCSAHELDHSKVALDVPATRSWSGWSHGSLSWPEDCMCKNVQIKQSFISYIIEKWTHCAPLTTP